MESTPLLTRPKKKSLWSRFNLRNKELTSREIYLGQLPDENFPPNFVCNQKYSILTFLPLVLYDQFRFFLNLYFLVMALSQFIPSIRIGYLYTYWGPLCFVLAVTLFREAVDDFRRYRRDKEVNRQRYERVVLDASVNDYRPFITEHVAASALRVGDIVMLHKGQRVPADMILLRTNETMGTVFIRTDQLDGEIDWKLRIPIPSTQKLPTDAHLLDINAKIFVEKPEKDIHSFIGTCTRLDEEENDSLDIENTLWSGCVVASGQATGLVIYTGSQTRSVMNNATPRSKVGRLELQVNDLTKVLFGATLLTSFLMIVLKGFNGPWYGFLFRFELLFSYIIPISLRVNLDMGKAFYSWTIQKDKKIEGTVMRSTTIPEELGRVQYLLADKTGTLTKNEMVFQKLHLGNALFDKNLFFEVEALLTQYLTNDASAPTSPEASDSGRLPPSPRQVWQVVLAIALCHNVTPVYEVDDQRADEAHSDMGSSVMSESCGGAVPQQELCDYQASSPDEVALVKWTDMMGVSLYRRDLHNISLKLRATNEIMHFSILQIFHFTSESKMMGIIVQEEVSGEITYYVKGADVALAALVDSSWLDGECRRLAADGLRTLVVAKKTLTKDEYLEFESEYKEARLSVANRTERTIAAMSKVQSGLTVLGLTGVEDRLADDVPRTMALLRAAGIKIWMLTGDKVETALCIARSLQLGGGAGWHAAGECASRRDAHRLLRELAARGDTHDLIIEGETLEVHKVETALCIARSLQLGGGAGWHAAGECASRRDAHRLLRELAARGDTHDLIIEGETLEVHKVETALCIARSLQLGGGAGWHAAGECASRRDAHRLLRELAARGDTHDLIIEGETLEVHKVETALCIARSLQLGGGAGWHAAGECASRRDAHRLLRELAARGDTHDLIIEGETLEVHKVETALCIARSLQLGGGAGWHAAGECASRRDAHRLLRELAARGDTHDLIIEGETLEICLQSYEEEFVEVLCRCSGVVVARCSPTQKARVARLLRARGRLVAAVGDGGNDVAMIQEADIGVGIEGAEGRAASLAGDVSVRAFSSLARLLLVHGRRAVMRSAALSLFIVHRGLIVSTMQAVFSVVFYFSSVSLYPGFLMVGYGTLFTMLPVFSLVLDKDIPSSTALRNPQLYKQLTKGRQLSYKTFYIWTGISIYQGGVIMYGALVLFEDQLIHIVEISYTALILTELIMVALTVVTWHRLMVLAELLSLLMYTTTLLIFNSYFDADFIRHWDFWWKVTTITLVSCLPLYIVKYMHRKWSDRQYRNLRK